MPVTISGDATKRIQALVYNLSDDRMRDLTIQLRDSLVRKLAGVQWSGGTSVHIMRGLTAHTEPVRTPTGGWMCGVGSLDILHREDAPPKTITQFLYWYQTQYMPAEKERRAAEKAIKAKKPEPSPAVRETQRVKRWHKDILKQRVILRSADLRDIDLRERLYELRIELADATKRAQLSKVAKKQASLRALDMRLSANLRRMREAEARIAELRAQR